MTRRQRIRRWLITLFLLHAVVVFAGFLAPYDPVEQDRRHAYSPPMGIHFIERGQVHLRPFFYAQRLREGSFDEFEEDTSTTIPLHFFPNGARYRLVGFVQLHVHLFGTDGGRLYLLGTDGFGRDQLSRILYGGQISLLSGLLGAGCVVFLGGLIGTVAGFYGGWRDVLLMRTAELFLALPWLYLLFALRAFLPLAVSPLKAFLLVIIVLGAVGWARPARLVRGVVLSVKERDFVRAARGFGAGNAYLMRRHVLPETRSVLLTQATILVPQFVLAEMTLSFLGLGIPEPIPSWGNLLAILQQYSVLVSYWWMYLPALAIVPFFVGYQGLANALQVDVATAKIEEKRGGIQHEAGARYSPAPMD
jgi:peptide/nickel transport system permease protein